MMAGSNQKYTAEQIIDAIRSAHGNLSEAARKLGTGRTTVYRYMERYSTIKEAYDEESERLIDFTEDQLYKQIEQGNITAIIFTLKTKGKKRGWIEPHIRNIVTGPDNKPIEIKVIEIVKDYGEE